MLVILPITIIFFWLEAVISSLPFFLIGITVVAVIFKELWVFALAFIGGIFLDAIFGRLLGSTSLFLELFLFLILLYESKYEIKSYPFVFASSFLGILIYLFLFENINVLIQSVAGSILAVLLFSVWKLNKEKSKSNIQRESNYF